ncbi:GNAT family N-acetyltransferase [Micromonospora endolithica]|uniref:N-acetyltransferase n=1 Tax=Micromonospora endolithica TaxID=230091 RepID=A0A3A9ZKF5_9ACTN|nr:GNAT family protein [Micromonospora endolithica]RKN48605.1 N-acetyltransferase [Micromonospora endolithica]TWJ22061.1 RimJ/RimL family protein N-acetyltransferase [Micromonospora endolithica]
MAYTPGSEVRRDGIRLRPVGEPDLAMLRRFAVEPGLLGLDWHGFRDPVAAERRHAADGWLGEHDGRLVVEVEDEPAAAGFVSYRHGVYGGTAGYREIGIVLLPPWRGRGIGWRAQALLCDYLFLHTPVQRVQAGTHPENVAEQRALERAGFQREGVVRAAEFRGGRWCDALLYSRLRDDPSPWDRPAEREWPGPDAVHPAG